MPDGSISVAEPIEKDGTLPKTESSRAGSSASSRKELPEQRPAHPDLLGKELQGAVDRWKIGRKLGQGTFGTVRVATGLGSGIVVSDALAWGGCIPCLHGTTFCSLNNLRGSLIVFLIQLLGCLQNDAAGPEQPAEPSLCRSRGPRARLPASAPVDSQAVGPHSLSQCSACHHFFGAGNGTL